MNKMYNPKSHAPAAYIPCWLMQVPAESLSAQAKILYGRLAQWSNSKGTVKRSARELAEEIGVQQRVVERFLKELRDVKLIETYQTEKGGRNCFRFLDHEWIHMSLKSAYDWPEPSDSPIGTPPIARSEPSDRNVGLKVEEVKVSKKQSYSAKKPEPVHKFKSASRSSDCLTKLPEDFCPDANGLEQLYKTASKVNMPTTKLAEKFKEVCLKYKTKSDDWQKTFIEFLLREKPKRTFEDTSGKRKRYDGGEIYN